jgi:hypothetical protein
MLLITLPIPAGGLDRPSSLCSNLLCESSVWMLQDFVSLTNGKHTMVFVFLFYFAFLVKMMVMYYIWGGCVNAVCNTTEHSLVCKGSSLLSFI